MKFVRQAVVALAASVCAAAPVLADNGFPFGLEMKLDAPAQPGSKRIPTLEIGESGEAMLDLWCKSGKGQFSVANDTVIFVAAPMQDRGCSAANAQADDALLQVLSDAATWKRQGDVVLFVGAKSLRFRLNTN